MSARSGHLDGLILLSVEGYMLWKYLKLISMALNIRRYSLRMTGLNSARKELLAGCQIIEGYTLRKRAWTLNLKLYSRLETDAIM